MSPIVSPQRIAELADQCVKCGLCVPLCPTYRVAQTEAESPRGRIAFAAAIAAGAAASASMRDHLDHCLGCMTCEDACPSHVKYGDILSGTRHLLKAGKSATPHPLNALLRHPRALQWSLRVAAALRAWVPARALREAPHVPAKLTLSPVERTSSRGRVALFIGCVAAVADRDVHQAARHLLRALGYDVTVPSSQGCCGALALHDGDVERGDEIASTTRRAFIEAGVDTVLVSASGCFGTLRNRTLSGTSIRVREIHEFLANDASFAQLRFAAFDKTIALHTPCTQANVVKSGGAIAALLSRIPGLTIASLPAQPRCCGAAGDYFLRHLRTADTLRAETLDRVNEIRPDLLVTSNVGCRVFLDNGLRARAARIIVKHPVVLLAEQLEN